MQNHLSIEDPQQLFALDWEDFFPFYQSLLKQELDGKILLSWLKDWSHISEWSDEYFYRLYVAVTIDTADQKMEARREKFMQHFYPRWQDAEQRLKEKLLESGLQPPGYEIVLRNMRAEVGLFREQNLPLQVEEENLKNEHDKVIGAQSVVWGGQEKTARQMEVVLRQTDRERRRQGWELLAQRQLQDRSTINDHWQQFMRLRTQIAANAGKSDYRAYCWQFYKRFDYTPQDCYAFHKAIEEVVVPAVVRLNERRRKALGLKSLRYYDLFVDPYNRPQLQPFKNVAELAQKSAAVFQHVHSQFGEDFEIMRSEDLLDLGNRKHKADGGYCAAFLHSKRPFIFANAVGIHEDVETLLHEGGHCFHAFESFRLPFVHQFNETAIPSEFAEVASMGMEYLASPYLAREFGGFYSKQDAARAQAEHLETDLSFWPYMAMVDAFQHWVYEHPDQGSQPQACDQKWVELERRFRPDIDWSGYEDVMATGWQRKDHIHQSPFYYIEYGLALLGAVQVWRNSLTDYSGAVEQYKSALALGGTVSLPQLFQAAGAKLVFDARTLRKAVDLMNLILVNYESG